MQAFGDSPIVRHAIGMLGLQTHATAASFVLVLGFEHPLDTFEHPHPYSASALHTEPSVACFLPYEV